MPVGAAWRINVWPRLVPTTPTRISESFPVVDVCRELMRLHLSHRDWDCSSLIQCRLLRRKAGLVRIDGGS